MLVALHQNSQSTHSNNDCSHTKRSLSGKEKVPTKLGSHSGSFHHICSTTCSSRHNHQDNQNTDLFVSTEQQKYKPSLHNVTSHVSIAHLLWVKMEPSQLVGRISQQPFSQFPVQLMDCRLEDFSRKQSQATERTRPAHSNKIERTQILLTYSGLHSHVLRSTQHATKNKNHPCNVQVCQVC